MIILIDLKLELMEDISENPLVSVGILTFNRPKGLRNALLKFTNQTYKNLDIIVSDDNPLNKENELIIKEFKDDSRIRYFKKDINEGMNLNFSYALSKANGEYFMWAADDDDWEIDFIEECIYSFKKNTTAVLCIPPSSFINEKYQPVGNNNEDIHTVGLEKLDRFKKYYFNSQIHNVGFYGLFKTHELKSGYLPNYLSNDRLLLLELSLKGEFIQIDKSRFYYNISGSSKRITSYLQSMKIKSKFIESAPHVAFNYLHFKSILFKWREINFFMRVNLLFIYLKLIKENGYYQQSIRQIKHQLIYAKNHIYSLFK